MPYIYNNLYINLTLDGYTRDALQGVVRVVIALNDILRFTSFYEQGSNEAVMVSFVQVSEITTSGANALVAKAYLHGIMETGNLQDVMHVGSKAVRCVMDNLTDGIEFGEWVEDISGTMSGDPAPPFVALSVKQIVGTRTTRAGYKRLPFVGEDAINGNEANVSALTRTAIEDFWGSPITFTATDISLGDISFEAFPLVIGRTLNTEVPPFYELDLTRINPVQSAQLQGTTSQTSRKP